MWQQRAWQQLAHASALPAVHRKLLQLLHKGKVDSCAVSPARCCVARLKRSQTGERLNWQSSGSETLPGQCPVKDCAACGCRNLTPGTAGAAFLASFDITGADWRRFCSVRHSWAARVTRVRKLLCVRAAEQTLLLRNCMIIEHAVAAGQPHVLHPGRLAISCRGVTTTAAQQGCCGPHHMQGIASLSQLTSAKPHPISEH